MRNFLILLIGFTALGPLADAHALRLFAQPEAGAIRGYAYFTGGARPQNIEVTAHSPDGRLLATTTTNERGEFQMPVTEKIDHLIAIDTGDGHQAETKISAAELETVSGDAPEDLRAAIRLELAPLEAQIQRTREELEAYQSEIRWRDVLGGIGFLVGTAGLAAFFQQRRKGDS